MDHAFSKNKRLLTKKEYERVFKQAKKVVAPDFFILTILNDKNTARLGFALSKKSLPKASSRNRVRRVIRESFRTQSELKHVDIVVLGKPGLAKLNNQEIRMDLETLWKKINKMYE